MRRTLASQFHKSPRRWTMLFQNWRKYAPLLFFNREVDIITEEDITKVNLIKNNFFSEDTNGFPAPAESPHRVAWTPG